MPRILFLFLDGVGLGRDDAQSNPLAAAELPNLAGLLGGRRLLAGLPRLDGPRAVFVPTDAGLGVAGPPQSATGQATILTGLNVPRAIGGHWGPKPNAAIAKLLRADNLFIRLGAQGRSAALLNAYPQRYFDAITSGRRNYSAVPLAVTAAGLPLFDTARLRAGQAMSADFTGAGWPEPGLPVCDPREAGHRLARLAAAYDFAFFEHWLTDYVGHRGAMDDARQVLERFDAVLGSLLEAWDDEAGLIVITSDHGNLEDLSHRHHTQNQVPTLVIGAARHAFADGLSDLTGLVPAVMKVIADG